MLQPRRKGSAGVTLVELIVVMAIILIVMAAVIVPRVLQHLNEARTNRGMEGAKEIHTAMIRLWEAESRFPAEADVADLDDLQQELNDYMSITIPTPNILRIPGAGTFYQLVGNDFLIRVQLATTTGRVLCIRERGVQFEAGGACPP